MDDFLFSEIAFLSKHNAFYNIILSGGSSPITLYKKLGTSSISFANFQFVLSDDRRVPILDPLSNEGMLNQSIGLKQDFKLISLHSKDISKKLSAIPSYKLAILGMGLDGHFASIFPGMSNLDNALTSSESIELVEDGFPEVPRITMTLTEIDKAERIILLVTGQEKLDLLLHLTQRTNLPIKNLIIKTQPKLIIATTP
ncbi:MAG: 6-phosphogluconolactonase [Gammaproteobacteria bacterium]